MYLLVKWIKSFPPSPIYTKFFAFQFTIFTSCTSSPVYIPTYSHSWHPMSNTTYQKWFHLSLIFQQQLPSSNIVVSSNSNTYELATSNGGGMHFILSDCGNFDFKIKRCKFLDFVKDVTNCRCLGCIFCFRIKEKEKDTFYINFYSTICLSKTFIL